MQTDEQTAGEEAFRAEVRKALAALPVPADPAPLDAYEPEHTAESIERARLVQRALYEAGLAGISWPTRYGGRGLPRSFEMIFREESAGARLPTQIFDVGLGMCGPTLLAHGSEEQKARFLPPLLRGEEVWCQLFSEPGAGSDLAAVATRAVPAEGGWLVTGQKIWTSGARFARFGLALTRTDPDVPKHAGITMMIIDMTAAGVEVRPLRQMTGHAKFDEVFLQDVFVPHDMVVGSVNKGWVYAGTTLSAERVSVGDNTARRGGSAELLIAAAQSAGTWADPVLRDQLVELYIEQAVVTYLREAAKQEAAAGTGVPGEGAIGKVATSRLIQRAAALGVEATGLDAVSWDPGDAHGDQWAARLLGAPGLAIGGGTDEILLNVIGERLLGLPREPRVDTGVAFSTLRRSG